MYPIAVDPEAAKDAVSKLKGDKAVVALQELIVSDAKDQYADFEAKLGQRGSASAGASCGARGARPQVA